MNILDTLEIIKFNGIVDFIPIFRLTSPVTTLVKYNFAILLHIIISYGPKSLLYLHQYRLTNFRPIFYNAIYVCIVYTIFDIHLLHRAGGRN